MKKQANTCFFYYTCTAYFNLGLRLLFIFISLLLAHQGFAQLTITQVGEEGNAAALVKNNFIGSGIKVLTIKYTGHEDALGTFSDSLSTIGFGRGITLSTGRVELIAGSNVKPNTSSNFGDAFFSDKHVKTKSSLCDGALLEIDFIPNKDSITLNLIFGSDEYPEFVGKEFNDVFKVVIEPLYQKGGAKNIARLGNDIIGLNSINENNNTTHYINNATPASPFYGLIEFDGFTTPISIGSRVTANKPHRLRILLVDLEDCDYDTGVLLEAYSFRSLSRKPKTFKPSNKTYPVKLDNNLLFTKPSKLAFNQTLDSLNRFTYDSLIIACHSEIERDFSELFQSIYMMATNKHLKCNKYIFVQQQGAQKKGYTLQITAYRKPE